jgi:septal ring-binding cell division protein DamX
VTFPPPVTAPRIEPTRPSVLPSAAPQAPTAAATAGRALEPPKPAPTAAAARQEPAARPPASSAARETWNRRAQRDRQRLNGEKKTRYAIQLELVCEVGSLEEAWKHDRGEAMWLLTTSHAGRDCYRVFWGRYPSLDAAKRAKDGIPSYFVTPRNRPAVVAVR